MTEALPHSDEWGYCVAPADPEKIVVRVGDEIGGRSSKS